MNGMEAYILDNDFEVLFLIDSFESFIWTERYNECGDFELYTIADETVINQIQQGYYVMVPESEDLMVIEQIQVDTDVEEGNHLTLSGRTITSFLDRRIIWGTAVLYDKTLQESLEELITKNAISPDDADRIIPGLMFESSTDPEITQLHMRAQYTGDNLLEVIETVCKAYNIGFRLYLNSSKKLVFKLYAGADRSYGQDENPLVIFSPKYDNVSQTSYIESDKTLKNVTLVAGEGEGSQRITTVVKLDEQVKNLDRRELYTDARDIQSGNGDEPISEEEYIAQLQQRGLEKLTENKATSAFNGEIEPNGTFVYGRDFFQGDILQVENSFGLQAKVRVTELVRSQDSGGTQVVPTFSIVDSGMNADERKHYTKVLLALSEFGIIDDEYNNDIESLTMKDISKLENHAILDEQYDGILSEHDMRAMLDKLEEHIILDDDYQEEEA